MEKTVQLGSLKVWLPAGKAALVGVCVVLASAAQAQPPFSSQPPPPPSARPTGVTAVPTPAQQVTAPASIVPGPPTSPASQPPSPQQSVKNAQPLEGGEIVARVDGQIILAGDVMWQVNKILDDNRNRIPPAERENVRQQILRQRTMGLIDTKLLYADFRRTVPAENIPTVEENLAQPSRKWKSLA